MNDAFEQLQRDARERARRLTLLGEAVARARIYVKCGRVHGSADALLVLFDASPTWSADEMAAALGITATAAGVMLKRCVFVEHVERGVWRLVPELTTETRARQTREAEEETRASVDKPRLARFKDARGRIRHGQQAAALRELFADGRERSTREVSLAFGWDQGLGATMLRLSSAVESPQPGMWRLTPESPEVIALRAEIRALRARVAELESR